MVFQWNMVNYQLQEIGFYRYFLPFALVFLVFYYVIDRTGLFKEKRINVGVTTALSFLVVNYTPFRTGSFGMYLSNLFGAVSVFVIVLTGILLVESFTGKERKKVVQKHSEKILLFIGFSLGVLFFFQGGVSMFTGSGTIHDIDFIVSRYELLSLLITGGLIAFFVSRLE